MDDIRKAFQNYDLDGNGLISFEEARLALSRDLGHTEEQAKRLLRVYDRNADGKLSYEEFIWFYWKIMDMREELLSIFKRIDMDNSGAISLSEARAALGGLGLKRRAVMGCPPGSGDTGGPDSLAAAAPTPGQLPGLSDDEIEALIRLHDTNADGQLQFDEFVKFWSHLSEARLKPGSSYFQLDPN